MTQTMLAQTQRTRRGGDPPSAVCPAAATDLPSLLRAFVEAIVAYVATVGDARMLGFYFLAGCRASFRSGLALVTATIISGTRPTNSSFGIVPVVLF